MKLQGRTMKIHVYTMWIIQMHLIKNTDIISYILSGKCLKHLQTE